MESNQQQEDFTLGRNDSRTFHCISESSRSRSACTLQNFRKEKLTHSREFQDFHSSSSSEAGSMEYMMELQTQLERLRMEKLSLLRANCNANKKISEMRKEKHGLTRHLETAKRQVRNSEKMRKFWLILVSVGKAPPNGTQY